jgi:Tfp pilus assembly protein PilZ
MMRAYSKDVGAMGLFIMANRPEKKGDQVAIEVDIPEMGTAQIQAVVAWTKWVPQNLRAVDYSGFGVRVTNATENWYTYFMNA